MVLFVILYQVLVDELKAVSSETQSSQHADIIISCCHHLVVSPVLAFTAYAKFDTMVT